MYTVNSLFKLVISIAYLFICAVLIVVIFAVTAKGHDHWINNPKYKAPPAAGYLAGTHCCGDKDVHTIIRDVDFKFEGDKIVFLDGPANTWAVETWNYSIVGKTWPRSLDQAYISEDMDSWITLMTTGILCVFINYGGY